MKPTRFMLDEFVKKPNSQLEDIMYALEIGDKKIALKLLLEYKFLTLKQFADNIDIYQFLNKINTYKAKE